MYKILIWGTGRIAQRTIKGMEGSWDILGYIESKPIHPFYNGKPIISPENMPDSYDYVIVANTYSEEVHEICEKLGIDESRFIYICAARIKFGCDDISRIKELLGERNFAYYCFEFKRIKDSYIYEDLKAYENLNQRENFGIRKTQMYPVLIEKYQEAGSLNSYFWQDLWAAKLIYKSGVKKHYDIGSRLDGFIAHLLAMDIEVTMIDIRDFQGIVEGLHMVHADATNLEGIEDNSLESLSALCSLEHFGLGRYGDSIDPEACFRVFSSIGRKMKRGGLLYISVPVGLERVEFNAHRIFYAKTIVENFPDFQLKEYSTCIEREIEYNVSLDKYDNEDLFGGRRYGLFVFQKKE